MSQDPTPHPWPFVRSAIWSPEVDSTSDDDHDLWPRLATGRSHVVVTFGDLARVIGREAANTRGRFDAGPPLVTSFALDQRDELVAYLLGELRAGDVVLLKGSRGLQMEEIVDQLRVPAVEGPENGDLEA